VGFVGFPPERAARYRAAGYWRGDRLDAVLRRAATTWPQRVAVADGLGSHTYAELDQLVDRAAAGFAAQHLAPGDRVLLQLPNSCRFAVALFGLLRAGAIPVMCLPGHRFAELDHFAEVSGAAGLVIDCPTTAEQLAATHPRLRHLALSASTEHDPPEIVGDTASPALLLVSGGTTGLPKLIPRTHDDYLYNATASAELCRLSGDDVYLVALPAAHNFPLACPGMLGAISVGATTVFTTDPSPEAAFAAIARHGVTVSALVPALAKLWAQACAWEPVPPTSLRLLQIGGAKLGADDARRLRDTLTPGVQQVFGMAEGLLNCTRLDDPVELVDTTQGRPLSEADELRVVDESGAEVTPGAEGELLVRGPYTLNGYFGAPSANEHAFTPDGFYRTGDRVRRLPDGYLQVTGRVKDVIHRGGETIAAADLEEHLLAHPAIRAAAAVPLPDEYLGEKICAAVVFCDQPVTLAQLNRYLDDRGVATHTRPDAVTAMAALPTTAVGKIDKKALARLAADQHCH
jgi:mycobactin salicyl-AMP ligase